MGQSQSKDKHKDEPFADVDALLKKQAWSDSELKWWQKRFFKSRYDLEINWSNVEFTHVAEDKQESRGIEEKKQELCETMEPSGQCLFKATFTNETGENQTHNLKAERETSSIFEVRKSQGYTIGGKFEVKLPSPVEVTGGLGSEFRLTKTEGETFTQKLSWSVDSQVTVPKWSKVTAELILIEKEFSKQYSIETKMRPRSGTITVYIRNKKTRQIIRKHGLLAEAIEEALNGKGGFTVRTDEVFSGNDEVTICCTTSGDYSGKYGAEQLVKLTTVSLNDGDSHCCSSCTAGDHN